MDFIYTSLSNANSDLSGENVWETPLGVSISDLQTSWDDDLRRALMQLSVFHGWQSRCLCRMRIGLSDTCYIFDCTREPPPVDPEKADQEPIAPSETEAEPEPEPEPESEALRP